MNIWAADLSLGVIYVVPVLPAALALSRLPTLAFAVLLALIRAWFLPPDSLVEVVMRGLLGFAAYAATGLLVVELVASQRRAIAHSSALEEQENLRLEAESHLRALAESSPAAIFTLDETGAVVAANRAASELFALSPDELLGRPIRSLLPVLADALRAPSHGGAFRTSVQSQGRRPNGDVFVAQTWFSTYATKRGRRLAAIAVDVSEEMREREEENLRQLGANQRIVAAAISHEIRNVCSAVALVHSRLRARPGLEAEPDFRALGELVEALGRIAAVDLQGRASDAPVAVGLGDILSVFRVIIEPDWQAAGGALVWNVPAELPLVLGESSGILQALINLAQNSLRAGGGALRLAVSVALKADRAQIILQDAGPGVANATDLFQPFRSGSGHTGLGLHISRANLRSYGGDLRHEPSERGARFVMELALARQWEMTA